MRNALSGVQEMLYPLLDGSKQCGPRSDVELCLTRFYTDTKLSFSGLGRAW